MENVEVRININQKFSYVLYHTDRLFKAINNTSKCTKYSFLREIVLTNVNRFYGIQKIFIKIDFEDKTIFNDTEFSFDFSPYENIPESFSVPEGILPDITINPTPLYNYLGSPLPNKIHVMVYDENKSILLGEGSESFEILPLNFLPNLTVGDEALLAKFITPADPFVNEITLSAAQNKYNNSIIAYQNLNKDSMLFEIKAIYDSIIDAGILYKNPETSTERFQAVMLQRDIKKNQSATCLDLALLFCSCLENVGYSPVLFLVDKHSFVGVYLEEFPLNKYTSDEISLYSNLIGNGINKFIAIECTGISSANPFSFEAARKLGTEELEKYNGSLFVAVNVLACHKSVYAPIPILDNNNKIDFTVIPSQYDDEELTRMSEVVYFPLKMENQLTSLRFRVWKDKLLDLNKRNNLISLGKNEERRLRVLGCKINELYDLLENNTSLDFKFSNTDDNNAVNDDIFVATIPDNRNVYIRGYTKNFVSSIRKNITSLQETGFENLFLCLGLITWDQYYRAPLLLLPISITKIHNPTNFTYNFDDLMINKIFLKYYDVNNNNTQLFEDLIKADFSEVTYDQIMNKFAETAEKANKLTFDSQVAFISNFSSLHYVMWKDLKDNENEFEKNKIINCLIQNKSLLNDEFTKGNVDNIYKTSDYAAPLMFDSSQLKAINDCVKGKSFVLAGPPGTGKSQTIVNMIINAFYNHKTVLFVAEKMAALSVVKKRLDECAPLGNFALELYSNQSKKTDFFDSLKRRLDVERYEPTGKFKETCNALDEEKNNLNEEIASMHDDSTYFFSLYQSIYLYLKNSKYKNLFVIEDEAAKAFNSETNMILHEKLNDYINIYSSLNDEEKACFFKLFKRNKLSYADKTLFYKELRNYKEKYCAYYEAYNKFVYMFDMPLPDVEIDLLIKLIDFYNEKNIKLSSFGEHSICENDQTNLKMLNCLKEMNEVNLNFKNVNYKTIDSASIKKEYKKYSKGFNFLTKILFNFRVKKIYKLNSKEYDLLDKKDIDSFIPSMYKYVTNKEEVNQLSSSLGKLFADDYKENYSFIAEYISLYESYKVHCNNVNKMNLDFPLFINNFYHFIEKIKSNSLFKNDYFNFKQLFNEMADSLKILKNDFNFNEKALLIKNEKSLKEMFDYCLEEENFQDFISLEKLKFKIEGIKEIGFIGFATYIDELKGKKTLEELWDTFCCGLSLKFLDFYLGPDGKMSSFNREEFENHIGSYKSFVNDYCNEVPCEVASQLTKKNFYSNDIRSDADSDVSNYKKIVSSHGRGITIRNFVSKYYEQIQSQFPCFLMSPLSVSQFLDIKNNKFDIVIFDEASQIRTCEAVGAIARGNSLVVAGDSQQMPPTNFFETKNEENYLYDANMPLEVDSLLDECTSINFLKDSLNYHYRSKNECLINYSNAKYYNGALITFPNSDNKIMALDIKYIKDINKEDSSISNLEIKAIKDAVIDVLTNPETIGKSFGIIVFNSNQQEKLQDFFDDWFADNDNKQYRDLNSAIKGDEYFIKNLETVQGDERDVIILSIGFKLQNNKAYVSGPIIRINGEKRLNVAITRSRYKMIVVSTIHAEDIKRETNCGTQRLKDFLTYVDNKTKNKIKDNNCGDNLAKIISDELLEYDIESSINLGSSNFKLDLALYDSNGNYKLGVLIDENPLNNNFSCRDRNFLEPNVLKSLNWQIINIYSIDYYRQPKKTIEYIVNCYKNGVPKENLCSTKHIYMTTDNKFVYHKSEYCSATKYEGSQTDPDFGSNEISSKSMASYVSFVLSSENPISYTLLKKRLAGFFKTTTARRDFSNYLDFVLRENDSLITRTTDYNDEAFYWQKDDENTLSTYREKSELRNSLLYFPKEEIKIAFDDVKENEGILSKEKAYRSVIKLLGFSVLTTEVLSQLDFVSNYYSIKFKEE